MREGHLGGGVAVLLVEDNPGDARLVQILLEDECGGDFRVVHAARLSEALDHLSVRTFGVVLLDLSLPDSQGLETLEAVRRVASAVPVVVLSGTDDEEMALRALQAGAQDYLVKGRADGNLMKRAILYSIERQRIRTRVLLAEAAFEALDSPIIVLDKDFHVIRVNPAFTRVTGFPVEQVEGLPPVMLASGEPDEERFRHILAQVIEHHEWEGEVWNRRPNGEIYPAWMRINAVRDEQGALSGHVAVIQDISTRKAAEMELVRKATLDPLTGLPNRALLRNLVDEAVERSRAAHRACGLLFVDLDGFKAINDTLGHDIGDEVLREVARRLKAAVRSADEVGRLAGDEFIVLLRDVRKPEDAGRVADKIVAALGVPYEQCATAEQVTASVGVALYPADGADAEALMKKADEAMYRAKKSGKNRWCLASEERASA